MGILGIVGNAGIDNGGFGRYEPKRLWAWRIEFYPMVGDSVLASILTEDVKKSLSTAVRTVSKFAPEVADIELNHGNESWFVPGKVKWNGTIDIEFDNVIPQELGGKGGDKDIAYSASSIFWSWLNLIQNSSTAEGLVSSADVKANIVLIQYHPSGNSEVERWLFYGAYPKPNFGTSTLDYASTDGETISVTFNFDKFLRIALGTNTPPSNVVDLNQVR